MPDALRRQIPPAERPAMPDSYGISQAAAGMVPWDEVQRKLTAARNYWISSTRPDRRPHAAPVWGLWLNFLNTGSALYFSTDAQSVKGKNLTANPEVVVHLESGDEVVILEGRVEMVYDRPELEAFADSYQQKYEFRPNVSTPSPGVYRLRLAKALAWLEKDFPTSATRWQFPTTPHA